MHFPPASAVSLGHPVFRFRTDVIHPWCDRHRTGCERNVSSLETHGFKPQSLRSWTCHKLRAKIGLNPLTGPSTLIPRFLAPQKPTHRGGGHLYPLLAKPLRTPGKCLSGPLIGCFGCATSSTPPKHRLNPILARHIVRE